MPCLRTLPRRRNEPEAEHEAFSFHRPLAIALGLLSGCSLFSKDKDKPAALEAGIPSTGAVRLAWSSKGDSVNFPSALAPPVTALWWRATTAACTR